MTCSMNCEIHLMKNLSFPDHVNKKKLKKKGPKKFKRSVSIKGTNRTMKVQRSFWEQRNMVGGLKKIMWEEPLVVPLTIAISVFTIPFFFVYFQFFVFQVHCAGIIDGGLPRWKGQIQILTEVILGRQP